MYYMLTNYVHICYVYDCNTYHRVADIWRSYFTQPLLWAANVKLGFMHQMVTQIRNAHDYMGDMHAENDLYRKSNALVELLSTWTSDRSSMQGWMEHLWSEMYTRGYIEIEDVELVQLWLQELTASGYSFPCIDDHHTVIPLASKKINVKTHTAVTVEPQRATVPLQGWYMKGGQTKTVHFLLEDTAVAEQQLNTDKTTATHSYAKMCAAQCEDDVRCIAWSFGPQKPAETTATAITAANVTAVDIQQHSVKCDGNNSTSSSSSSKQCWCTLHEPAVTAAGATDAVKHKLAIIGAKAHPTHASITYSGVVQRDVTVYTGKPADTTQPNRILLVVNFHWPISQKVVDFMTQKMLPLCLPTGFDLVIIGPHSSISGVLLNPWSNKGHFAGISPTLAYTRFPNYDGELVRM